MDDFSFGNVWGDDSSPKPLPAATLPSLSRLNEVKPLGDDFDAFEDDAVTHGAYSVPVATAFGEDDDFGDFGDFGDAPLQADDMGGFDEDDSAFGASGNAFASTSFVAPTAQNNWRPLRLDPLPSLQDLTEQVDVLLEPLWDERLSDAVWSGEGIREVEGISQILVTPERSALNEPLITEGPHIMITAAPCTRL